ncbi:MAG: hypothetical protein WCV93_03405 [Candidatus Shapirobacteria bacterium]|jgi:hypothetical protein
MKKSQFPKNKGQVSLVVLLAAAVITTLGLSLSKKTVLETKIDIDDELQKQAFNTAESGIEYFLGTGTTTSLGKTEYRSSDGKSRAEVTIETIGNSTTLDFNELILPGKYQYFWLAGHDAGGELNYSSGYYSGSSVSVCAGSYTGLASVNFFYRESGVSKVRREMINFDGAGGCLAVNLTGVPVLLTVSPVGLSSVNFSLRGTVNFPGQGNQITAVGQAGDLTGEAVKSRVRTLDRYSILPFMLEPLSAMGGIGY